MYVKLSDPAETDGSSVPQVEVLYLAGTAASTPAAPATPARSLVLAQITVPASGGGSPTVAFVAANWNSTVRIYRTNTSGQSIPNASQTTVTGWTLVESSGGSSYSAGVWTIAVDGVYNIISQISYPIAGSPVGIRKSVLYKNSTVIDVTSLDGDSGHITTLTNAMTISLLAGDTVHVETYQSQGSSQSLTTGAGENHITITRIGPL